MNNISDIMKGGISAILIAFGYIVLLCAIICLIMQAMADMEMTTDILWCGVGCLVFAVLLMGSGIGWYYIVKPKP